MSVTTLHPAATGQRRQRLIDAAVDLDGSFDLADAITARRRAQTGPDGSDLWALLQAAAWRDLDHLAGHLADVAYAARSVEMHGLYAGHAECCDDDCTCTRVPRHDRTRCDACEAKPHEHLEHQVDQLLGHLRATVRESTVDDYLAGAA